MCVYLAVPVLQDKDNILTKCALYPHFTPMHGDGNEINNNGYLIS